MTVGSVVNAIAIIRHLSKGEQLGVNAIARAVEISPSTCFNILKTLADESFVDFDPRTKHYSLGSEPVRLFGMRPELLAWTDWLDEELARMVADFAITSGLWRVAGRRVLLVQVEESTQATRIHLVAGQRLPYVGALGRCIAAAQGLTFDEVPGRLAELRWQRPITPDAYWSGVQDVLRRGWAIDEGFYLRGVTTIAAPIFGINGAITHCVTSTMFSGQHEADTLNIIGERTSTLAREASDRLASASPRSTEEI
jgi:DNA-binding IclR family transcriptional regulator